MDRIGVDLPPPSDATSKTSVLFSDDEIVVTGTRNPTYDPYTDGSAGNGTGYEDTSGDSTSIDTPAMRRDARSSLRDVPRAAATSAVPPLVVQRSPDASQFEITLQWFKPAQRGGGPRQVNRLQELIVNGRSASASLKNSVQQQLDSFDRFDDAGARCRFVRSGGTVPVLTLHGVMMIDGKLTSKHEEIRLR